MAISSSSAVCSVVSSLGRVLGGWLGGVARTSSLETVPHSLGQESGEERDAERSAPKAAGALRRWERFDRTTTSAVIDSAAEVATGLRRRVVPSRMIWSVAWAVSCGDQNA
ncbi:hypothetical protein AB0I39_32030 [Kitasatospora purpeofusca]|uniref:hypothetical protein n=1 Tax=Kitasatospora purpeofusca TaxID=67352 RepID=UPI0033E4A351